MLKAYMNRAANHIYSVYTISTFSLSFPASTSPQGENANFTYHLDDPSGAFGLDPVTGWLTVSDQTKLDRESQRQLRLDIYADELVPNVLDRR